VYEDFPGKALTRVLNRKSPNPLSFNEQLVYSCLVRHGKGATQKQLARATGLERSTCVRSALRVLHGHGLAAKRGRRWHACEPPGEAAGWFACRSDVPPDAPWPRRFAYWWLGLRSRTCPLTLKQLAVYFKHVNLGRCSVKGLAGSLGLDRNTVRTAVARLRELGLLGQDPRPRRLSGDQLAWLLDRRPGKQPLKISTLVNFSRLDPDRAQALAGLLDRTAQPMTDAGYSEHDIRRYWAYVFESSKTFGVLEAFVPQFFKVFADVERDHEVNRRSGKLVRRLRNSLGLLRCETGKVLARLRRRHKIQ
jgi:DNA-binding MarR family transcriptional regulator